MKDTTMTNSDEAQNRLKVIPAEVRTRLERKLLSFGGSSVIWQKADPQAALIELKGQIFAQHVQMKPGEPNKCHSNAADLWARETGRSRLVTGYALHNDRWWSHSWVVDDKNLYETTHRFDRYFGVELVPIMACRFWIENFLKDVGPFHELPPGFWEKRPGILALIEALASMPKEDLYRQFEECSHGLCA